MKEKRAKTKNDIIKEYLQDNQKKFNKAGEDVWAVINKHELSVCDAQDLLESILFGMKFERMFHNRKEAFYEEFEKALKVFARKFKKSKLDQLAITIGLGFAEALKIQIKPEFAKDIKDVGQKTSPAA